MLTYDDDALSRDMADLWQLQAGIYGLVSQLPGAPREPTALGWGPSWEAMLALPGTSGLEERIRRVS